MSKFKRDELRVIVVFGCLAGLFFQLVAQTVFGAVIGDSLTNSFVTLILAVIADSAWEKFASKRGGSSDDQDPPSALRQEPSDRQRSNGRTTERSDIESLMVAA